jgi:hypothetical protein
MVLGPTESGAAPTGAAVGTGRAAGGGLARNAAGVLGAGRGLRLGAGLTIAGSGPDRIAANWNSARCSFGVMSFGAPCETMRVSITIMTNPTTARRAFTTRTMTAERESPKSNDNIGAAAGLVKASAASRTALCSSGPMELSLSHSTSPASSCKDTAWVRLGSTAARTFSQTILKSTSGLSDCIKGLPCSINPLLEVYERISTVLGPPLM